MVPSSRQSKKLVPITIQLTTQAKMSMTPAAAANPPVTRPLSVDVATTAATASVLLPGARYADTDPLAAAWRLSARG